MPSSAQPERKLPASAGEDIAARAIPPAPGSIADRVADSDKAKSILDENELDSALQLLVERAQYITGATGAALALPQGDEMVCRASAGRSAPAVGARLQVRSGLTGESIARRQLLRCDNAETDPRVNLETCRALGIASIVVLPLMRKNGDVRGLFELFSDHPYAFEERDLIALERMADLTATALDLAEQRQTFTAVPPMKMDVSQQEAARATAAAISRQGQPSGSVVLEDHAAAAPLVSGTELPDSRMKPGQAEGIPPVAMVALGGTAAKISESTSEAAPIPEAMRKVRKCASCGFPVSEGRTFCLDCERAEAEKTRGQKVQAADQNVAKGSTQEPVKTAAKASGEETAQETESDETCEVAVTTGATPEQEVLPPFLANAALDKPSSSWLADHVNLLAIVVLILGILVAIVTFR